MDNELIEAVMYGNYDDAQELLDQGYDPDVMCENETHTVPLLFIAIEDDDLDMVELLVDNGADVNAMDEDGNTALMVSLQTHNLKMVSFLLRKHVNVNTRNMRNETALQLANMYNWPEAIELLYRYGAKDRF